MSWMEFVIEHSEPLVAALGLAGTAIAWVVGRMDRRGELERASALAADLSERVAEQDRSLTEQQSKLVEQGKNLVEQENKLITQAEDIEELRSHLQSIKDDPGPTTLVYLNLYIEELNNQKNDLEREVEYLRSKLGSLYVELDHICRDYKATRADIPGADAAVRAYQVQIKTLLQQIDEMRSSIFAAESISKKFAEQEFDASAARARIRQLLDDLRRTRPDPSKDLNAYRVKMIREEARQSAAERRGQNAKSWARTVQRADAREQTENRGKAAHLKRQPIEPEK